SAAAYSDVAWLRAAVSLRRLSRSSCSSRTAFSYWARALSSRIRAASTSSLAPCPNTNSIVSSITPSPDSLATLTARFCIITASAALRARTSATSAAWLRCSACTARRRPLTVSQRWLRASSSPTASSTPSPARSPEGPRPGRPNDYQPSPPHQVDPPNETLDLTLFGRPPPAPAWESCLDTPPGWY